MIQKIRAVFGSVFLRYMLSYAVLLAVLFTGVSVYMYNYYSGTIRRNTVENSINKLSRIRYENETNIGAILNTGSQIGLSPYVVPFRFSEEPWNSYQLKKQIVPYTVTNSFYDQLFLIFDSDDYLYSSLTSVRLDLFLNRIMLFENTAPEELKSLIRTHNGISILNCQTVTSSLLDGKNTRMVTIIVPLGASQSQSIGSLIFMIKESAYLDLFADEIYEESNTYITYNGSVMVNSKGLDIPDGLVLDAISENEKMLEKEITHNSAKYLLVALRGQMNGMQYCTVLPLNSLTADMKNAQLGFWIFLIALSVPCMFLIYYLAHRNYKPIRDLRHMFTDSGTVSDDFMAIRAGIRSLVGRNVDLKGRLDESMAVQKSGFITNFVKSRFKTRQSCVETAGRLGMDINKRYFAVALIGIVPGAEGPNADALFAQAAGVSGYGVEVVALDQLLFALFADDKTALEAWTRRALEASRALGEGVAVSMSGVHEDFKQAAKAYLEANTAFDNRFIMGNTRVLRFEDVSAAARNTVPNIRGYMDALKKSLRSGEAQAVNTVIDELFSHLGGTNMSLFAFRLLYNDIISVVLNEQIAKAGSSVDALHIYDVFTLSNCRSIDDLDDMLRKLCNELLQQEKPEQETAHPEIRLIVEYMSGHFADPNLNMSAIADRFNMSAARLSLDFKELMGVSPSDYLLLLRMEKSKELLSATDMSIKDICTAVGYFDTSGFIRRFRHYLAMTPMQYRQNARHMMK